MYTAFCYYLTFFSCLLVTNNQIRFVSLTSEMLQALFYFLRNKTQSVAHVHYDSKRKKSKFPYLNSVPNWFAIFDLNQFYFPALKGSFCYRQQLFGEKVLV